MNRYIEEFSSVEKLSEYPFVYFMCNSKNEHISSSDLRGIQTINRDLINDWNRVLNKLIINDQNNNEAI
ncbi:MAG: hypothetical protein QXO70_03980 [Candidatus Pacearchaeota archaeon]